MGSFDIHSHLDPSETLLEILFGLIMAFTLTAGARFVYDRASFDALELVVGLVGCNVAWGVIDGAFYLIGSAFNRGRRAQFIRRLQATADQGRAIEFIREEFSLEGEPAMRAEDRARFHETLLAMFRHASTARSHLRGADYAAAATIVILVTLTALPAAIPLLAMKDGNMALKVANYLQIGLLFGIGCAWTRYSGGRPWVAGGLIAGICTVLVLVAVALGG
jgi:hypothetical protein